MSLSVPFHQTVIPAHQGVIPSLYHETMNLEASGFKIAKVTLKILGTIQAQGLNSFKQESKERSDNFVQGFNRNLYIKNVADEIKGFINTLCPSEAVLADFTVTVIIESRRLDFKRKLFWPQTTTSTTHEMGHSKKKLEAILLTGRY